MIAMTGNTAKVSNASFQFTYSITTMMLRRVKKSPKIATTPEEKRSFSTSTSVVTRVTRRPTGLRSKKAISSRCKCRKSCLRRSYITFCPTNCMANDCENSSMKLATTVGRKSAKAIWAMPTMGLRLRKCARKDGRCWPRVGSR